jgi:hypothetical protein
MNKYYVQSANTEVLNTSMAITDITAIVCDMLQENVEYTAKNGLTEKAKLSRQRLLTLLDVTELFNTIATQNATLKTANGHLYTELNNLKQKLKDIDDETNLANSI